MIRTEQVFWNMWSILIKILKVKTFLSTREIEKGVRYAVGILQRIITIIVFSTKFLRRKIKDDSGRVLIYL